MSKRFLRWLSAPVYGFSVVGTLISFAVAAAENPVGVWRYDKGGFNDDITLQQGGAAMSAKGPENTGQWRMEGDELVISWRNGWTNRYRIGPGPGPFSGVDVDKQGAVHSGGTFSRAATPAKSCINIQVTPLDKGMTQYVLNNHDCGVHTLTMPTHHYCALSWVHSGGFNSGCQVMKRGRDWVLQNIDPAPPDGEFIGQSQVCGAICFD